jgi:hypothetical protein
MHEQVSSKMKIEMRDAMYCVTEEKADAGRKSRQHNQAHEAVQWL